eukprot:TRINITY_DN11952_c0_g1_i1.p1 TRINITY_DN11952_c0_g1~~TRINITY_DN11952_c0_g1_i1.p1  ORF type:complete len:171 (+),score=62.79 TRINITY_DN11952_c0_g1_i1:83-595(+)
MGTLVENADVIYVDDIFALLNKHANEIFYERTNPNTLTTSLSVSSSSTPSSSTTTTFNNNLVNIEKRNQHLTLWVEYLFNDTIPIFSLSERKLQEIQVKNTKKFETFISKLLNPKGSKNSASATEDDLNNSNEDSTIKSKRKRPQQQVPPPFSPSSLFFKPKTHHPYLHL